MSSGRPVTEDGGVTGNRAQRGDDPAQKTTRTEGRGTDEQHSAGTPWPDVLFLVLNENELGACATWGRPGVGPPLIRPYGDEPCRRTPLLAITR
jgi:hypothetical protein